MRESQKGLPKKQREKPFDLQNDLNTLEMFLEILEQDHGQALQQFNDEYEQEDIRQVSKTINQYFPDMRFEVIFKTR